MKFLSALRLLIVSGACLFVEGQTGRKLAQSVYNGSKVLTAFGVNSCPEEILDFASWPSQTPGMADGPGKAPAIVYCTCFTSSTV